MKPKLQLVGVVSTHMQDIFLVLEVVEEAPMHALAM